MDRLTRRTALVTGGAVRIGRELVLALAASGVDVAVHYGRSETAAHVAVAEVEAAGARATCLQGELTEAGVPERLIAEAGEALGPVTILVNNASIFESGRAPGLDPAQWARMHEVNARVPLSLALAMWRALPEGMRGDVVNINDSQVLYPRDEYFAYTASKWSLHHITRDLAMQLAPQVKVNQIALGPVLPPEAPPESYEHTARDTLPMNLYPRPDDVSAALIYLIGARATTGQTIFVDGGQHLKP